MTVLEALREALDNDGWIRQGPDGPWCRPRLMFNRWRFSGGGESQMMFGPRDLIGSDWQWTAGDDSPGADAEVHG